MAPHSSTLAWIIPWMEKSGGLQSMGLLGVSNSGVGGFAIGGYFGMDI